MKRADRLYALLRHLNDGAVHRADDLAAQMHVSARTIYRDIERLADFGIQIKGTPGTGYKLFPETTLPPLRLSDAELQVLHLGIAIVSQSGDADLSSAAEQLADKLDNALAQVGTPTDQDWKFESHPFSDMARGLTHLPLLRAAIKARQKLRLTYHTSGNRITTHKLQPLALDNLGRVWTLTARSDRDGTAQEVRVDLIQSAQALPEMFV